MGKRGEREVRKVWNAQLNRWILSLNTEGPCRLLHVEDSSRSGERWKHSGAGGCEGRLVSEDWRFEEVEYQENEHAGIGR